MSCTSFFSTPAHARARAPAPHTVLSATCVRVCVPAPSRHAPSRPSTLTNIGQRAVDLRGVHPVSDDPLVGALHAHEVHLEVHFASLCLVKQDEGPGDNQHGPVAAQPGTDFRASAPAWCCPPQAPACTALLATHLMLAAPAADTSLCTSARVRPVSICAHARHPRGEHGMRGPRAGTAWPLAVHAPPGSQPRTRSSTMSTCFPFTTLSSKLICTFPDDSKAALQSKTRARAVLDALACRPRCPSCSRTPWRCAAAQLQCTPPPWPHAPAPTRTRTPTQTLL